MQEEKVKQANQETKERFFKKSIVISLRAIYKIIKKEIINHQIISIWSILLRKMNVSQLTIPMIHQKGILLYEEKKQIFLYKFKFQGRWLSGKIFRMPVLNALNQTDFPKVREQFKEKITKQFQLRNLCEGQNVLKYISLLFSGQEICIVQEKVQSTLKNYLNVKKPSYEEKLNIIGDIAMGIKQLQQGKVCHRNITIENVMICDISENESQKTITKLSDFSEAILLYKCISDEIRQPEKISRYSAPELLIKGKNTSKCDLWSLGVIFYEMLFQIEDGIKIIYENKKVYDIQIQLPEQVPSWLKQLTLKMLSVNPDDRYPIEDVLRILNSAKSCAKATSQSLGQKKSEKKFKTV